MKVLETKYHSQRNNKILPFSTCGTTCLSEYLSWLNIKNKENFECDDDRVFEILNSPEIIAKAKDLIGIGETYIKDYLINRTDNPATQIDESKYNTMNQLMIILCETGEFITNYKYKFIMAYQGKDNIQKIIDNNNPLIVAGKFTASGHYVMIVGYDENNWIIDDPYGDMKSGYKNPNGSKVYYSKEQVDKIIMQSKGKVLSITAIKKTKII